MKKHRILTALLLPVLLLTGCGAAETPAPTPSPTAETVSAAGTEAQLQRVIDSRKLDLDGDGVSEDCTMVPGPTSGLFTVVITVSSGGGVKYRNTFNLAYGEISFGEEDGEARFVRDGESHRLYVDGGRIVIDGLDPEREGYWGGAEWNYDLK